jgi:hypothetical protein
MTERKSQSVEKDKWQPWLRFVQVSQTKNRCCCLHCTARWHFPIILQTHETRATAAAAATAAVATAAVATAAVATAAAAAHLMARLAAAAAAVRRQTVRKGKTKSPLFGDNV